MPHPEHPALWLAGTAGLWSETAAPHSTANGGGGTNTDNGNNNACSATAYPTKIATAVRDRFLICMASL